MKTQTTEFAVEIKDAVVKRIGKSVIYQPKTEFKGGRTVKWYEDKLKKSGVNNDSL